MLFFPPKRHTQTVYKSRLRESVSYKALETQQFGVTLDYISASYHTQIPPVLKQCIEYLDTPERLQTVGIFRISPSVDLVRTLKERIDNGQQVELTHPHVATNLIKMFLRELREPIIPSDMFEYLMRADAQAGETRLPDIRTTFKRHMPELNAIVLEYLLDFIERVIEQQDHNKMDVSNMAMILGPNLCWPRERNISPSELKTLNEFVAFLLKNYKRILRS